MLVRLCIECEQFWIVKDHELCGDCLIQFDNDLEELVSQ
jgi:hypothetical protein